MMIKAWLMIPIRILKTVSAVLLTLMTAAAQDLPGAAKLTAEGDLAMEMVAGLDRFATRELQASGARRAAHWRQDFSSPESYLRSVAPNRARFMRIIGAVDGRQPDVRMELITTTSTPALVGAAKTFTITAVRWPVLDGVYGEGLLLKPRGAVKARAIAIGDADQTPEALAGLLPAMPPGVAVEAQFARRLAENGCEVLIPALIDRADTLSGNPQLKRMTNQPHREFIYRMAFQMGRHIIGYEVQKILAAVDWFENEKSAIRNPQSTIRIGVFGYGEGGLLALYSAAADPRIDAAAVSGYFQSREEVWREPIYRNVWGLLEEFGDAEIAALIAPRPLVIEASRGPEIAGPPPAREGRSGAAPGVLISPPFDSTQSEFDRARGVYAKLRCDGAIRLAGDGKTQPGSPDALRKFLSSLGVRENLINDSTQPKSLIAAFDPAPRLQRQFAQLVEFTQKLARQSERRRAEFMRELDSAPPEGRPAVAARYRDYFWDEVIGRLPAASLPFNVKARLSYDEPKWRGYEVTLDVWPDVFAYGFLLLPKDLKEGERRPVVVCQHGLEGRPQMVVDPRVESVYRSFAARLADRGFIVFAPQNPYIGKDRFRVLQRKLNPLKKSLYAVIVRQHERVLEWLGQLPFVDPERIGFYGLSYGGKSGIRISALLPQYALSICSGDFNEWIVKTTNVDQANSYMFLYEYEIPEFDLGNTFNYAEMTALIAPRPFMVERGHDDPVGVDELVAYEFAKTRRLYLRLGIERNAEIEFFDGRHEIRGQGSFDFLHRHLRWPKR